MHHSPIPPRGSRRAIVLCCAMSLVACDQDPSVSSSGGRATLFTADGGTGDPLARGDSDGALELTGTFYPLGEGDDFPDAEEHGPAAAHGVGATGLFEVHGGGLVRLRFPGQVALPRGTTLRIRGLALPETNTVDVVELLATSGPDERALARMEADRRSRDRDAEAQARSREARSAASAGRARQSSGEPLPPEALAPPALDMLIIPYFCDPTQTSNGPATPTSADFAALVNGTITPWMKVTSWFHRTYQVTSLPWTNVCTVTSPLGPPFTGHTPEEAALAIHNVDANLFDRVVLVSDGVVTSPTGAAESLPGRRMVVYGSSLELGLWLHELGHLEGLFHAHALRCTSPTAIYSIPSTCASFPAQDLADTMSWFATTHPTAQFSSAQVDALGWLAPTNITTMTVSGYVDIAAYSESPSAHPMRAVKVPLASGTLYIEQRRGIHNDAGLQPHSAITNGVLLRVHAASIDSNPNLETFYANPQLLDARTATTHWKDAALPYNTSFYTPEGVAVWATPIQGGLTRVYVKFPDPVRISQPRNVRATNQSGTGTALVEWDPPTMLPPGATYVVAAYPSLTVTPVTGTSAVIGGLRDGLNAFAVRAVSPGLQSEFVGSNVLWEYALPTAASSVLTVPEPTSGTTTASVTLTLPYPPSGGPVSRVVGSVTQGSGPGFADTSDFVFGGAAVSFLTVSAGTTTQVNQDGLSGEPVEVYDVVVIDQVCVPLLMLNGCMVPRRLVEVSIPAN